MLLNDAPVLGLDFFEFRNEKLEGEPCSLALGDLLRAAETFTVLHSVNLDRGAEIRKKIIEIK